MTHQPIGIKFGSRTTCCVCLTRGGISRTVNISTSPYPYHNDTTITGTFANGRTECQTYELLETHKYTPEKCLQHLKFLNQSEMRWSDLGAFERIFETMCTYLVKWQDYNSDISLWPGRLSELGIVGTAWIYTGKMLKMSSAHQPVIDTITWPECIWTHFGNAFVFTNNFSLFSLWSYTPHVDLLWRNNKGIDTLTAFIRVQPG